MTTTKKILKIVLILLMITAMSCSLSQSLVSAETTKFSYSYVSEDNTYLSKTVVPVENGDNEYDITLALNAYCESGVPPQSFDIVIAMDTSASMGIDKMNDLKDASIAYINYLYSDIVSAEVRSDSNVCFVLFGEVPVSTNWQSLSQSKSKVTDNIKYMFSILTITGTHTGLAMKTVENKISGRYNKDRAQIVLLVTDGIPSTIFGIPWYNDVGAIKSGATRSIEAAYRMKQNNVSVFTVGIGSSCTSKFPNANTNSFSKFLDYVSSNYPDAQSIKNPGNPQSTKTTATRDPYNYYEAWDNETDGEKAFKHLAIDAISMTSGFEPDGTLNNNTVIMDTVSDYFEIVPGSLKAKTLKYIQAGTSYTDGGTFADVSTAQTIYDSDTAVKSGTGAKIVGLCTHGLE